MSDVRLLIVLYRNYEGIRKIAALREHAVSVTFDQSVEHQEIT
jgi:hypothetical protein